MTPTAIPSLKQKTAVGASFRVSNWSAMAAPEAIVKSPWPTIRSPSRPFGLGFGLHAAQAVAAEGAGERSCNDADTAVSQAVQVIDRLGRGPGVVDVDAGDAQPRAEFAPVDDRGASRRQAFHQRRSFLGQAMAEKNQAIGLLALEHRGVTLFALVIMLRVAEEDGVPPALRRVLDALQDLGEERVGDVGHRDQQLARAQRAQVRGRGIRRVAEPLDRLHHLLARSRRDHVGSAEHARDGCR
jgi:hypothetical protein